MNKKIKNILTFLGLAGLLDSIYLSLPHFSSTETFCFTGDTNSCDLVLSSEYATMFFDIPNAFLGVLFYLTLTLIFIFWDKIILKIPNLLKISVFITTLGTGLYLYFIYLQAFVIESYCPYCLLSAFLTFAIWIKLILVYYNK